MQIINSPTLTQAAHFSSIILQEFKHLMSVCMTFKTLVNYILQGPSLLFIGAAKDCSSASSEKTTAYPGNKFGSSYAKYFNVGNGEMRVTCINWRKLHFA